MQEKIAANTLHMQTICVDIFSPLLDRFNFDWDDTNFVLEDIDMNQTDFYQSYQQYLTEYEQRLTRTESIIATTQRRYRVASFDHKVIKKMRSAIKKIMKSTPFSQVKQAIKSLWVDYEVNYLLKVLPLLENTHFPLLVEKFHDDIYNRALADTLLVAEKHYQVFHRYLRLDELSGTIPFLSALCHHRRDMYLMSIEKHL